MYRQQDYDEICAQLRTRRLAVYGAAAALFALAIVSFALRWPQGVTSAITAASLCVACFCHVLFVSPVSAYRKHIDHALHGHTHNTQGTFVELSRDAVTRDGLALYPLTVNVGAGLRDDGDRLFYYDANLPRPDWQAGETLLLTSYDNRVTAWTRARIKA